jgi:long-chain acyl-CoA synthetase
MHPRQHGDFNPDRAAVVMADTGATLSYGDLERRANQGAHLRRRLGLRTGATVTFWLTNTAGVFEIYWAAQRAGLYRTAISTAPTAARPLLAAPRTLACFDLWQLPAPGLNAILVI